MSFTYAVFCDGADGGWSLKAPLDHRTNCRRGRDASESIRVAGGVRGAASSTHELRKTGPDSFDAAPSSGAVEFAVRVAAGKLARPFVLAGDGRSDGVAPHDAWGRALAAIRGAGVSDEQVLLVIDRADFKRLSRETK